MDKLQVVSNPDTPDKFIKFSEAGLESLGEIYVYLPKVRTNQLVEKNQVLAVMETSRCTSNIRAPFTGKVLYIERSFLDNPCDINYQTLFIMEEREPT